MLTISLISEGGRGEFTPTFEECQRHPFDDMLNLFQKLRNTIPAWGGRDHPKPQRCVGYIILHVVMID